MQKFAPEHLAKIKQGIILYNREEFWECHEDLEGHWLEARGSDIRNIYWAVIQVAAALLHYLAQNQIGASTMIAKAREKIKWCEEKEVETELMEKFLDWSNFKSLVFEIPHPAKLTDFEKLYRFKFPDPLKWEQVEKNS